MTKVRSFVHALTRPLRRFEIFELRDGRKRGSRYATAAIVGLTLISVIVIMMLRLMPERYTCRWTIMLPGAGSDAHLVLQGIGQASSNSASPYASVSRSPRVNYRELVFSDTVLNLAAKFADLSVAELGRPRVKLVTQSSLMNFAISAPTPELATRKAEAISRALHETLDRLRKDEMALREAGMRSAMEVYTRRLQQVRAALLEHQEQTQMISADQIDGLIASVNGIERELVEIHSEVSDKEGQLEQMRTSLGISDTLAAAAIVLKADETIQGLIRRFVDAWVLIESKRGVFGADHPRMIAAKATLRTTRAELRRRTFKLLQRDDIDIDRLVLLAADETAGRLLQRLVSLAAELDGTLAKEASMAASLQTLRSELQTKLIAVAKLSDLERDHKIAEAVFSSALARIDTGKSNLFVSYPLIQTISNPAHPGQPDQRAMLLAIAGGILAGGCLLIGLLLLWFRAPS
ncbi:MAG: hypothetical protein AAFN07_16610 [Pseudomonadota bacterium]